MLFLPGDTGIVDGLGDCRRERGFIGQIALDADGFIADFHDNPRTTSARDQTHSGASGARRRIGIVNPKGCDHQAQREPRAVWGDFGTQLIRCGQHARGLGEIGFAMQFKVCGQHFHRSRHLGVRIQRHAKPIANDLRHAHVGRRKAHQPRLLGAIDHHALQTRLLFLAAFYWREMVSVVILVVVIEIFVVEVTQRGIRDDARRHRSQYEFPRTSLLVGQYL